MSLFKRKCAGLGAAMLLWTSAADAQVARLESVVFGLPSLGGQGNGDSTLPGAGQRMQSDDGRFVVFVSRADNLTANDDSPYTTIFVRDTTTGQTFRISDGLGGRQGNGPSSAPTISADGRYVAFESLANNLVANDVNERSDIFVRDRQTGVTTRVSVDSAGVAGNQNSTQPSISADGRYVAFVSNSSNLIAGGSNGLLHIYVHDRVTASTVQLSISAAGQQATNHSANPAISADGAWVAFDSDATNLVPADTNGQRDVFVRERAGTTIVRVSVGAGGAQAVSTSQRPAISADGMIVAFESLAANLVAGDSNGRSDVFVHQRASGTTTRVSVATGGAQATGGDSLRPSLSADGRFVAFQSDAANLVAGDSNNSIDVFRHDRNDASTVRASLTDGGAQANLESLAPAIAADGSQVLFEAQASNLVTGDGNGFRDVFRRNFGTPSTLRISLADMAGPFAEVGNGDSFISGFDVAISADGDRVAFASDASNLVPADSNGVREVFVRSRQAGSTQRVCLSDLGVPTNQVCERPAISRDGRFVAFHTSAALVAADTNGSTDVYVRDLQAGTTERVSIPDAGGQGNGGSFNASISGDGRFVSFESGASNLVTGDTNSRQDIFVRDRQAGTTVRVSVDSAGVQGNQSSFSSSISADGRFVAFASAAMNLVASDSNGANDIFVRDLQSGTTTRVSVDSVGTQATGSSGSPAISFDGRYVAFESGAANLVSGDTNSLLDVFRHDRNTAETLRVSVTTAGTQANNESYRPALGDLGEVAFYSFGLGSRGAYLRDPARGTTQFLGQDAFGAVLQDGGSAPRPAISADALFVAFPSWGEGVVDAGKDSVTSHSDVFVVERQPQQRASVLIVSDTPDPSVPGQPVLVSVEVTGDTAPPLDGRVRIQAPNSPGCFDLDGPTTAGLTATYSCTLSYTSTGSLPMTAQFSHSATHLSAGSPSESHSVVAFPTLSIADLTQAEGNAGNSAFAFTVTRSHTINDLSFQASTSNGSAQAGSDYTALSNQLVQMTAGGSATTTVTVQVQGDTVVEQAENFFVGLANPVNATFADSGATGTITNDDGATLSINDISQVEGTGANSQFQFTISLNGAVQGGFNVPVQTQSGTAIANSDFSQLSTNVGFAGELNETRTVNVTVFGDPQHEANETFFVDLSSPGFPGITLSDPQGLGTIQNDDAVAVNPATLPAAQIGVGYNQTLSGVNGIASYSFALTSGALPAGLALSAAGQLSGTPTAAGSFNFDVQATDSTPAGSGGPFSGTRSYTLSVAPPTIALNPTSLPNGLPPQAYSQNLAGTGGTAPYAFAVTGGALPPGLTLSAAGLLSGNPNDPGDFSFTVTATDSSTGTGSPFTGQRAYTLRIDNNLPTASAQGTLNLLEDHAPVTVEVTVGDVETAPGDLVVTAESSAPALLPAPVVSAGPAANTRNLGFDTNLDQNGTAIVDVRVEDEDGGVRFATIEVLVTPVNDPPVVALAGDILETAGASGFRARAGFVTSLSMGPPDEQSTQSLSGYSVVPVSDPNGVVSNAGLALNGTLTYTLSGSGGTATLAVTAIDNGGSANGGNPFSTPVEFDIQVPAATDLQISKSDGRTSVVPGDVLLYDIFVANAGPSAVTGARVQDVVPASLTGATWSCTPILLAACPQPAGSGNIDQLVDLAVGGVLRYSLMATVVPAPGPSVANTAQVTTPAGVAELAAANNSDTDTNAVLADGLFVDGFEDGPNVITVPFER